MGFAEAIPPRTVGGTGLQQSDHRVLPVAPLDDVKAFGVSLRHYTIIPEQYDNSTGEEFARSAYLAASDDTSQRGGGGPGGRPLGGGPPAADLRSADRRVVV